MTTVHLTNTAHANFSISEEEKRLYLNSLQDETNFRNIPTVIFLTVLAIVGMLGNCLILLVYSRKRKTTATIVLIQSIAAVDLIGSVIVIPDTIYSLFRKWDFPDPYLCKVFGFFNYVTATSSATFLLAVAIVRYKKVCIPLGSQVTIRQAKIISIVIAVLFCLATIPYGIVFGVQDIETGRAGISGKDCAVDQKYVNTIWPFVIIVVTLLFFLSYSVLLTAMYVRVGITAYRHDHALGRNQVNDIKINENTSDDSNDTKCNSSDQMTKSEFIDLDVNEKPTGDNKTTVSKQMLNISTERKGFNANRRKLANHTIRMLVTISVVYITSMLTTLFLLAVRYFDVNHFVNLGAASDSVYRVFLQIFKVNFAANPLIYAMCDRNFRIESVTFLKSLFCKP